LTSRALQHSHTNEIDGNTIENYDYLESSNSYFGLNKDKFSRNDNGEAETTKATTTEAFRDAYDDYYYDGDDEGNAIEFLAYETNGTRSEILENLEEGII